MRCFAVLGLIMALHVGILAENKQGTTPYPDVDEFGIPYPNFRTPSPEEWDPSPCEIFRGRYRADNGIRCTNISSPEELVSIFARLKNPAGLYMGFFELTDSTLQLLPDGVFGNATFISVTLLNNFLEVVERNVLKGMKETLKFVRVERNQIKTLDFVKEANNAEMVMIVNEKCEEIPDYAFTTFSAMRYVDIRECPVHTVGNYAFANLPVDSTIYITRCSVTSIGNYAFANGSGHLQLINRNSAGPVTKIGDYAFSSDRFKAISMLNVKITDDSLSSNTFEGVRGFVTLSHTSLTTLKEEVFSHMVECRKLIITGKLKCDESMDWIINKANATRIFRYRCEDGKSLAEHICTRKPETCKGNCTGAA